LQDFRYEIVEPTQQTLRKALHSLSKGILTEGIFTKDIGSEHIISLADASITSANCTV